MKKGGVHIVAVARFDVNKCVADVTFVTCDKQKNDLFWGVGEVFFILK